MGTVLMLEFKMPCFHQRRVPGCSPSSPGLILLMWLLGCNNSFAVVIFLALLYSFPGSSDHNTEIFVNQIIKNEYVPFRCLVPPSSQNQWVLSTTSAWLSTHAVWSHTELGLLWNFALLWNLAHNKHFVCARICVYCSSMCTVLTTSRLPLS